MFLNGSCVKHINEDKSIKPNELSLKLFPSFNHLLGFCPSANTFCSISPPAASRTQIEAGPPE